jgi:hypothetical protein
MSVGKLLSRLEKVRLTRPKRWIACHPAHDGCSSLAQRELEDGPVLLKWFAVCIVELDLTDLFPTREIALAYSNPECVPFSANDILRYIASEALIVLMSTKSLLADPPSDVDHKHLMLAVARIREVMDAGGISHAK